MTTLADLNRLSPADRNATPWVSTPDGSWTRMAGGGVNPEMLAPPKETVQAARSANSGSAIPPASASQHSS
jgi:hypothetical protein